MSDRRIRLTDAPRDGTAYARQSGAWVDVSGVGSYLGNLVEDTTPQLGGSLDVNGNKIVSVSSGDIDIEPHGTGNVLIGNLTFDADQTVGAGQDNYVLTYDDASGQISLEAAAGGISDLVDDTTPQLGGDLDGNNFDIVLNKTVYGAEFTFSVEDSGDYEGGLLISASDPFVADLGIYLDAGLVAIVGSNDSVAGAHPAAGDTLYISLDFLTSAAAGSGGAGQIGWYGDDVFQIGCNVIDGPFGFYTLEDTTSNWKYPLWIDPVDHEVLVQDGYDFVIGDGGYGTAPTSEVKFAHDGTDLNIAGTSTTDINVTGITALNVPQLTLTTALDETYGGTGQSTISAGDILYGSAANTLSKLAAGTDGHVLTLASGVPSWAAASGGSSAATYYKTADESVTTSTTYQNDNHFASIPLDGSAVYKITGCLAYIHSSATGDIKAQFTWAGANADNFYLRIDHTATNGATTADAIGGGATEQITPTVSQTTMHVADVKGFIITNASTTACTMQWAQIAASGTTTMKAGSWLTFEKIS